MAICNIGKAKRKISFYLFFVTVTDCIAWLIFETNWSGFFSTHWSINRFFHLFQFINRIFRFFKMIDYWSKLIKKWSMIGIQISPTWWGYKVPGLVFGKKMKDGKKEYFIVIILHIHHLSLCTSENASPAPLKHV